MFQLVSGKFIVMKLTWSSLEQSLLRALARPWVWRFGKVLERYFKREFKSLQKGSPSVLIYGSATTSAFKSPFSNCSSTPSFGTSLPRHCHRCNGQTCHLRNASLYITPVISHDLRRDGSRELQHHLRQRTSDLSQHKRRTADMIDVRVLSTLTGKFECGAIHPQRWLRLLEISDRERDRWTTKWGTSQWAYHGRDSVGKELAKINPTSDFK